MESQESGGTPYRLVLILIGIIIVGYVATLAAGWPQRATEAVVNPAHETEHAAADAEHPTLHEPPLWTVLPFVLLLGAIALLPLIHTTSHWWEHNRNKFMVAAGLAIVALVYYLILHEFPVASHWPAHSIISHNPEGANFATTLAVIGNAMLSEYVPFIVLLFSLYTISGGIRLEGDLAARPLTNTIFLAVGGALASIIGTTGAAMLLIRPLLETNRERQHVKHTVVFFIFIVCNCGGCLLPTGDPPLFLGYLLGVPFLWTLMLWKQWLFINVSLLVIYFVWDTFIAHPKERRRDDIRDETQIRPLRFAGVWPNAVLLLCVIITVAVLDPGKPVPGTTWHPWMYLREVVQLALVGLSLLLGSVRIRTANSFNFGAIIEVAALFFGIFICMQPALQILELRGDKLGMLHPWQFFWASGSLSSFLDNAPTYVVFFETAKKVTSSNPTLFADPTTIAGVFQPLLIAVSLGAVFMGANTYIGNGPNFMVKSIAESSGVKMPSFFGYMAYSIAILIPLFILTTFLFM